MKSTIDLDAVATIFREVQRSFPHLRMLLELDHPHVDISMDIPEQEGLRFTVNLNLQGDELHMSAGGFWLEWFPCTDESVVRHFLEAVRGILSGRFRILQYSRWGRVIGAELQQPRDGDWETIGISSHSFLPFRWLSTPGVLRNA
jgi:hypothetical protein